MSDQRMMGKVGRCTAAIRPNQLGEVMVPIRGGSEAFHAYATEKDTVIEPGSRIVVVEYHPPRTVVVTTI